MKKIFAIAFLSLIIFPNFVFAADSILKPYWGPIVSCVGGAPTKDSSGKEIPTCTSLCDLFATAQNALRLGVTIALYVLVPAYFLYGGFKIATTGVSGDKIATARKMLFEAMIGVVIILGSFTIINTFMNGLAGVLGGKGDGSSWLKISCVRQGVQGEDGSGASASVGGEPSESGQKACGSPDPKLPGKCAIAGSECVLTRNDDTSISGSYSCAKVENTAFACLVDYNIFPKGAFQTLKTGMCVVSNCNCSCGKDCESKFGAGALSAKCVKVKKESCTNL